MKRAAGWIIGGVAFLGMSLAALLVLRPLIFRDRIRVVFVESDLDPCPASDAMRTGFLFAIVEREGKAGRYKVDPVLAKRYRAMIGLKSDISEPVFSDGTRAPDIAAVVLFQDLPDGVANPFPTITCLQEDGGPGKGLHVLPTLEQQGAAAARWAKRMGLQRVTLIADDDGQDRVGKSFREQGTVLGLAIKTSEKFGADALLEFRSVPEADLVFYSGEQPPFGRATQILKALRSKGYNGLFMTADACPRVSFTDAPGPLLDGCLLVSPLTPPPPQFQAPFEAYAGKRQGPHVYAGTLAGRAVLDALEREGPLRIAAPDLPCGLYVAKNGAFEFVEVLR